MKKRMAVMMMALTMACGTMTGTALLQTTEVQAYCQGTNYTVYGTTNYLALRSNTCYDDRNEIGRIYNGETVVVMDTYTGNAGYWYVYSPKLGMYGYVNKSYLSNGSYQCTTNGYYTVCGVTNYLAIRSSTCYDDRNEIGRIYNGDRVEVISTNTGNAGYWKIYSPSTGLTGYVNRSYLV